MDKHAMVLIEKYGMAPSPVTPQMFASAGREHMEKYGEFPWSWQSDFWPVIVPYLCLVPGGGGTGVKSEIVMNMLKVPQLEAYKTTL